MLKVTKQSDDRVDIELSGKIEAIEMAVALDDRAGRSDGKAVQRPASFGLYLHQPTRRNCD